MAREWMAVAVMLFVAGAAHGAETVSGELEGRQLLAYHTPAPAGAPTVLLLHGTLAHGQMEIMTALAEVFAEQGWGSLAITLSLSEDDRVGMYDCAAAHRHLYADSQRELAYWMGWLRDREIRPVVMLGHSRGARQVAAHAASVRHEDVRAVVLLAPSAAGPAAIAAGYERRYGVPLDEVLAEARRLDTAGEREAFLEDVGFLHCETARVTAASFLSYYRDADQTALKDLVAAISQPVLVVSGTEDPISAGLGDILSPSEAPPVALFAVEGADHFFRDLYTYDVVDAVQAFVAGLEGP